MTRQRIKVVIDAVTVEGAALSGPALAAAIEAALAERLAGSGALTPASAGLDGLDARAAPASNDRVAEAAVGRAVAGAAMGMLRP
jgi:hypothetical protein